MVKIPHTKNKVPRTFTITGNFYDLYKKYSNLRPLDVPNKRFFLNYQNGKCTKQVVGINKFGGMAKQVALFLQLPNPEQYTGHCFRRTSATLLVDAGGDLLTLKRHGGWRSSTVAEGYVGDSLNNKITIANKILQSVEMESPSEAQNIQPSTSLSNINITENQLNNNETPGIHFQNCSNITINYNFK